MINPLNATNRPIFESARAAGHMVGLEVQAVEVNAPDAVEAGFGPRSDRPPDALLVAADALFVQVAGHIAALGIERKIAVVGPSRNLTEAGALLSYGRLVRRSAYYVKQILAGVAPRDLPVEQPSKFDLVINLKTATALGLTLPPGLLARADEVIE